MIQGGKFHALRDPRVFCCIFRDPRACRPALSDPRGFSTRFGDPRGSAPRLPGSTRFCAQQFQIHVSQRPAFRDPRGSAPHLSGSTWVSALPSRIHVLAAPFFCCFFLESHFATLLFSWLFLAVCSSMARSKGGGPADEEIAAKATVAAIVKELEARFDVDLVRKVATKMFKTFSSHLDAEAVAKKRRPRRRSAPKMVSPPPFPYYTHTSVHSSMVCSVRMVVVVCGSRLWFSFVHCEMSVCLPIWLEI